MASKRYKNKLDRLEKIKQQIKDEEKRIEQDLGKFILKKFDLSHEDYEEAKLLIEELKMFYEEKEKSTNESNKYESNNLQYTP